MTDTNHIIEAIDHALEDYATSGDAMRWTPEPRPEPGPAGGIGCWAPLGTLDGDEGVSFTIFDETQAFEEEIVPSYMDVVRTAVWRLAAAAEIPRQHLNHWSAERPADHTEHVHIPINPRGD